jgi:hypothetical protein
MKLIGRLTMTNREVLIEVDNFVLEEDQLAKALAEPQMITEEDEVKTYKDLQDSLTNLNSDGNTGIGEEGDELESVGDEDE